MVFSRHRFRSRRAQQPIRRSAFSALIFPNCDREFGLNRKETLSFLRIDAIQLAGLDQ
jgi:hypothetical protein